MIAYKGFDENLQCRGFQYEIGKTYQETKAELCRCGFHACKNPLDVLTYYYPTKSRYCVVELEDVIESSNTEDTKVCGKKITIKEEIGLDGLIEAATNAGDVSVSSNTGDGSVASNTGYCSVATNTGNWSVSSNTGKGSVSTNTGSYSVATNTGLYSAARVTGDNCIAIAVGYKNKAAGAIGCWLVLAERDDDLNIKDIQAVLVDGEKIKPDVYYTLSDGKVVEVE